MQYNCRLKAPINMNKVFKKPENCEFNDLHEQLLALGIASYKGLCLNGDEAHVIFEESKTKFTATETKKLEQLFDNYIPKLSLSKVRELREPLFTEADWRFNKALDESDTKLAEAIKQYRKQLRDITLIENTSLLEWPQKPWL